MLWSTTIIEDLVPCFDGFANFKQGPYTCDLSTELNSRLLPQNESDTFCFRMTLDLQTDQLPTFDSPPVVETVLSAQFDPIANLRTVHFGLFWQRMRDRFPGTDEKTAIEPIFEQFDQTTKRPSRLHFEVREEFKLGRLWLLNEMGTEMIQLQSDRFIKNWRKVETGEHYPRYQRVIKPAFLEDFEAFKDFIHEEKLGSIAVNQCEVTYVNHIVAGEGWTGWSDARKVFSFLSPESDGIEDAAFICCGTQL